MNLEELSDTQWEYLTVLHTRCFIERDFQLQRFITFKNKIEKFKQQKYNVEEFEHYIRSYEKEKPI